MSVARPQNLKEWQQYISTLKRDQITSKLIACNTLRFCDVMLEEGLKMEDIEGIFRAFAKRLIDVELRAPGCPGGAYSIVGLMDESETLELELPKDVEYEAELDDIEKWTEAQDAKSELEEAWDSPVIDA